MFDQSDCYALFDDNLDDAGDLLLTELEHRIECASPDEVAAAFAAIEAARARGSWIALAAHYELGYALEPRLRGLLPQRCPLLRAWIFRRATHLSSRATQHRIDETLAARDEHLALGGVAMLSRNIVESDYREAIDRIREWIDAGDCYQVNFTFALTGHLYGSPLALYRALRAAQPVRHGALIGDGAGAILSRSPELFVEKRGKRLVCRPMKGTAARSTDPAALAASEKNRAENVMIVDLIRNDLGRLAPAGGVRVERLCEVEPYPTVWQMTSTIEAAPVDAALADIFRALFPCGSITGAPKIRAMEIIHALEHEPRGIYCGALGWIAPDGDFRLSVPIRTLDVDPCGQARLGLGGGIVADSDPQAEWDEALLKGRFLTDLRPAFGLIETLRCDPQPDAPYPLLERHLRRLAKSAACFGFSCDPDAIRAALAERAASLPAGKPHRVRLELRPDGAFAIAAAELPAAGGELPTVVLSSHRVDSGDLLLRHKTTARRVYDAELQRVAARGHFDALFLNEKGELAEGARTNVFLDAGSGELVTPLLECGALDGVYRRKLLDEGRAREARLTETDLRRARTIYLANAARGLFPARLVEDAQ